MISKRCPRSARRRHTSRVTPPKPEGVVGLSEIQRILTSTTGPPRVASGVIHLPQTANLSPDRRGACLAGSCGGGLEMGEAIDAGRGPAAGKLDAVFEGGGVRGIGLVGAISVAEAAGYQFENVAGTSAGAIVATLLACGYNAAELKQTIGEIDFRSLTDLNGIGRIPIAGALINVLTSHGIYEGDAFLTLMRRLLAAKVKRVFRDVVMPQYADDPRYRYKFFNVGLDVTRSRM